MSDGGEINTLFHPCDSFFINRFAKLCLGYANQTFLDFVNDILITFEEPASLSGHTLRSETTRNRTGRDLIWMLDASSLRFRAAVAILKQGEPYADAHYRKRVLVIMWLNSFSNMDTYYSP